MSVFVLSGAGLSAESGVATFRDPDGLWLVEDLMEVATPQGFARNPQRVYDFYNSRRRGLPTVGPNAAHQALARLQAQLRGRGSDAFLCTQNVDDLLERAGAATVCHMHGELTRDRCHSCSWSGPADGDLTREQSCPRCGRQGTMRPDVVWFGEIPYHFEAIMEAIQACSVFVSIGTSGEVYPAAGLVEAARAHGAKTLEFNLKPSANADRFDEGFYGPAGSLLPDWVDRHLLEHN